MRHRQDKPVASAKCSNSNNVSPDADEEGNGLPATQGEFIPFRQASAKLGSRRKCLLWSGYSEAGLKFSSQRRATGVSLGRGGAAGTI
jgi:hypothetical protein